MGMKKEYIVELREEEADELMDEHWVGELVRCKDCKHGEQLFPDYISCQISDENESGCHASHKSEWFCADGEAKDKDGHREKVIKGLNSCSGSESCVSSCPYYDNCENNYSCTSNLAKDALALLKEQQKLIDEITQRRANNGAFD